MRRALRIILAINDAQPTAEAIAIDKANHFVMIGI
jgi:hypothetical protein